MIHAATPTWQKPIKDPARLEWHEACLPKPLPALQTAQQAGRRRQVTKVAHYYLAVDAITQPMRAREEPGHYGDSEGCE